MPLKILSSSSIGVAAGKGGVGKSTLTVLLAGAFKRRQMRVGILDADLYGPSLRHLLPEERLPRVEEGKWKPALSQEIQLISMAYFQKETAVRAPMANQVLGQFLNNVAWESVDQLLIDFPPGTGDIPMTVAQAAPLAGVILVTTPQEIAVMDVRKSLVFFQKMRIPVLGIVENMVGAIFGEGGGLALSYEFSVPFLGSIPLDPAIRKAAEKGTLADLEFADPLLERVIQTGSDPIKEISLTEGVLTIEWKEGEASVLRAESLQKECPCAHCKGGASALSDVAFLSHDRVGRYGLRFRFSSGCSYGIYDFSLLKRLTCAS
ncbi:MAG: Iron-sulfur cluster carrier protein [Chlamydiales bacterium]|nr:Iron-sulfur cluster carrier protein [Chlamydiales bacterium]